MRVGEGNTIALPFPQVETGLRINSRPASSGSLQGAARHPES